MILIIEDNEQLAQVYCRFLTLKNYESRCMFDGSHALKFVELLMPSMIIVDLALPDMNGVAFLQRARSLGFAGPAVAMSGALELMDSGKLDLANFVMQVTKPIMLSELEAIVSQFETAGRAPDSPIIPCSVG